MMKSNVPQPIEQSEFRAAMSRLGAAVNIITTDGTAGQHGFTASAVCSVTDTPPTVLVCVNRSAKTNEILKANGVFCVNVLAQHHEELSGIFAARDVTSAERFKRAKWSPMHTGAPHLEGAVTSLDCTIDAITEVGTHTVFYGNVVGVRFSEAVNGLIYFNKSFHALA